MPKIYDNIEQTLLPGIEVVLQSSVRANFCVGYFNLRGWRALSSNFGSWSGQDSNCVRLLIGMHTNERDELRQALRRAWDKDGNAPQFVDNAILKQFTEQIAADFRDQLTYGSPSKSDEQGLKQLSEQLKTKKLRVKLHARYPLHAKLYLFDHPTNPLSPTSAILGSSNLTFAGLKQQGELNVEVTDRDTATKLADWFEKRWTDRGSIDISERLAQIIDESWVTQRTPYHIYLKIAYHLSLEARTGINEFNSLPPQFERDLFKFQKEAVRIAAGYLMRRGGVLIGDVVGLGKTMVTAALLKMLEELYEFRALIICPANLVPMWSRYKQEYNLKAKVRSLGNLKELDDLRGRYPIVVVDESHNLRNRDSKRHKVVKEFVKKHDAKVILLSATPYNKSFDDLSSQLRLFLADDAALRVRPERLIKAIGEAEFKRKHQCDPWSIAAFEKSEYTEDWRDLMSLYLVRRTRSFVTEYYADKESDGRRYLTFPDGKRAYFPKRVPRNVKFKLDEADKDDQYARLYTAEIVDSINRLNVPRYGLGNYVDKDAVQQASSNVIKLAEGLGRAGKRLMGFCRTNLFKRLESSGFSFLTSIERHLLRNLVFLYAIDKGLELPIGSLNHSDFDTASEDEDVDVADDSTPTLAVEQYGQSTMESLEIHAQNLYELFRSSPPRRFKWIGSSLFTKELREDLKNDNKILTQILQTANGWDIARDHKLTALAELLESEPDSKFLVFTQFSDTALYLTEALKKRGLKNVEAVIGGSNDPTNSVARFSPNTNGYSGRKPPGAPIRVLISTDVLSEGQNLQDAASVVNFDIPWAIIRLVQRAGRIDRIGQEAAAITCYSFWPAAGVDRLINLRNRVKQRLEQSTNVLGSDERFFEEEMDEGRTIELYNENSEVLELDDELETDLPSRAYEIWHTAIKENPELEQEVLSMPNVVFSTKTIQQEAEHKAPGVLAFIQTAFRNEELVYLDEHGQLVTESPYEILNAAACLKDTPTQPERHDHHKLVEDAVRLVNAEQHQIGGQLGTGNRRTVHRKLQELIERQADDLFAEQLRKAQDLVYKAPLTDEADDAFRQHFKLRSSAAEFRRLVTSLYEAGTLVRPLTDIEYSDPLIVCSLGLVS